MSPPSSDRPIRQALKRVAVTLKAADVPFALAGSYASWARGGPEPEHDADFLVRPDDVEQACAALSEAGLRIVRPAEDWLAEAYDDSCDPASLVDIIHAANRCDVDLDMIERAAAVEVDSVWMPVISATDFVLLRLQSLSEHSCDMAALLPHVRAPREQVDWEVVRREAKGTPFAEAFLLLTDGLGVTGE